MNGQEVYWCLNITVASFCSSFSERCVAAESLLLYHLSVILYYYTIGIKHNHFSSLLLHKFCTNERNNEHYILQPHHIFIRLKAFIFMLVPGGLQFLTCFVWRLVTSISKCHVLTAHACVNCNINAWLSLH